MQRLFRWISLIILANSLIACSVLPTAQNPSNSQEDAPIQQAGLSPTETVEAFLMAWHNQNYEAMYGLLSNRTTEIYPFDDFRAQYTTTHTDLGFVGISYEIHDAEQQGTSAAIHYDVSLDTATFGGIIDENRIMRLVQEGNIWAVAWSPMDIINGMTANVRLVSNRSFPRRGNIYDRNGSYLVNENGTTVALYMRLSDMRNREDCTRLLASLLLRPVSYFRAIYPAYESADSVFFVGEMDNEIYNRYSADLNTTCGTDIDVEFFGAKVQPTGGRSYFGHGAATHVTGYLGRVSNAAYWAGRGYSDRDLVGGYGVELAFMDELAGAPDISLRLIDSSNVTLRELGSSEGSPSYPVTLTIDRELQWNTAKAFSDAWVYAGNNWVTQATGGAAVVMDVNTGQILSMFSFPTYDPRIWYPESTYYFTSTTAANAQSQIETAINNGTFLPVGPAIPNRAFTEQYFPGSVFKIFSILAAADSGIWEADELFDCTLEWDGSIKYGDTAGIREDWRVVEGKDAAGPITMSQALTASCNPFFWETAGLMFQRDSDLLYNYLLQFGLGQPTGLVGLVETEASGNIPQPNSIDEALNDVIGQGNTSVTAVQMAQMVSAVANGGTIYRPYLVQQIGGADGTEILRTFEPEIVGELGVSDEAIEIVRRGMCQVPINEDLGTSYGIFAGSDSVRPSYTSCGKTGTAQTASAPNSWYVTYAPAENPQIAVVVVVPNSREGSEVAAPIARRIMDHYFNGPIADFPWWWPGDYIPVQVPRGVG